MKEQIQQLIATDQIKEALDLLTQLNSDAVMLKARFHNARNIYVHGVISNDDFAVEINKIRYAMLAMLDEIVVEPRLGIINPATGLPSPEIFLIYNKKDIQSADVVRRYLKKHGISNVNDYTQLNAGQEISDFVANKALKSQFVLILISLTSLKEGWMGVERHLDVLSNSLLQRNVIPLALDNSLSRPRIVEQEITRIEEQLDEIDERIRGKLATNRLVEDLEAKRTDLTVFYNNLPKIVQRLRNVLVVDISGSNFEPGMKKVLQIIQKTVERVASAAY